MSSHLPANITFHGGDLFTANADALVNPVNCVGVMGAGLAKQFKDRDPAMFTFYREQCARGLLQPGRPVLYDQPKPAVILFPTKQHWRRPSQLEWIDQGLGALRELLPVWGLATVAVPPLGAGLGGLAWPEVRDLIVRHLGGLPILIHVYGTPPGEADSRVGGC